MAKTIKNPGFQKAQFCQKWPFFQNRLVIAIEIGPFLALGVGGGKAIFHGFWGSKKGLVLEGLEMSLF